MKQCRRAAHGDRPRSGTTRPRPHPVVTAPNRKAVPYTALTQMRGMSRNQPMPLLHMKRLTLTFVVLLVLGVLVYEYGGRLITQRQRVADFQWKLPPDKPATLSDSLAVEGIELALRASSRDPANWQPVPIAQKSADNVLRKGQNPDSGLVILSNSNSAAQLYATVQLDSTNRALDVTISRPK